MGALLLATGKITQGAFGKFGCAGAMHGVVNNQPVCFLGSAKQPEVCVATHCDDVASAQRKRV